MLVVDGDEQEMVLTADSGEQRVCWLLVRVLTIVR